MPPRFRIALVAWVKPPVLLSAVFIVNPLLLVNDTAPVTVTLGMESVPNRFWEFVSKECTPVPARNVPLLVRPPLKLTNELAVLFVQVAPLEIVTRPSNRFSPVAEDMVSWPLVPPPMLVEPVTVSGKPATVNVVPSPRSRLPEIESPTTVVVDAVPRSVRFCPIEVVPARRVFVPLPESVRLPR